MKAEVGVAAVPQFGEAVGAPGMSAVAAAEWNSIVAPGQAPIAHDHLAAWEHAELPGLQSRPLLVRDANRGRLLAAAPGYFYDLDLAATQAESVRAVLRVMRRAAPRLLLQRVYEVGTPTPLVPPFLRCPSVGIEPASAAILRAALREAAAGGAAMVLAQNFESTVGGAADVFRGLGFLPVPIPPTVVVELPYGSFEDYLGAMRAQYRRRARQVFRLSAHLKVEHVRGFASLAPELARLWKLVFDRARELRREILPAAFFRGAAAGCGSSLLLLRRPDSSIACFALLLDDDPCLHFLYTGFEERARCEGAYFRLLYEIVRLAIEGGFTQANLGLTTLEPKLDVGGVPIPLYAWLHHRRPALRRCLAYLGSGPFAPAPAAPRNVFKT